MKKNILIIAIILFYSITTYGQTIQSLNVSPNNNETIDVNLEIFYHQYIDYLSFDYEIIGNDINLNVCYHHAPANVIVYDNKTFIIPIDNLIDYTLSITIYRSIDLTNCDYNSITDTATLQFTTPLTETVYLSVEDFEVNNNQIKVFPNPVNDILNITFSKAITINTIEIYNILGAKIKSLSNNFEQLDVNGFNNGAYFLKFDTNKGVITKKILVNN